MQDLSLAEITAQGIPLINRTTPIREGKSIARAPHEHARYRLWRRTRANMENHEFRLTPKGLRNRQDHGSFEKALGLFDRFLRFTGLHDLGVANTLDIRLNKYEFLCGTLPKALDGYRVLHLSDLHLDMLPGLGDAVADVIEGIQADLCVLTGDYRAGTQGVYDTIMQPLGTILSRLDCRDGIYATLGNHDDHQMVESLEGLGMRVLVNEAVAIERGTGAIQLIGLDDAHAFFTPAAEFALHNAKEGFSLVLAHSPDLAAVAARSGHQVYLCGHTHGGQICLPGGLPIITHCEAARKLTRGTWKIGDMLGLTNVGCGVSGLPVRFFSRGEVALITLRSIE